jgi:transposase-like protein
MVARMRAGGMTYAAIAKRTGIPISTLHEWCTSAQAKKSRAA